MENQPSSAVVHNDMAERLLHRNKLVEAEAEYRESLQIEPRQSDAHAGLAQIMLLHRRFDEAIKESREAIDFEPKHWKGRIVLLTCLLYRARRSQSPQHLQDLTITRAAFGLPSDTETIAWLIQKPPEAGEITLELILKEIPPSTA